MGIEGNYSLRESGLWVPKYENNPPKTYQNWSETYANQSSQQATVQTVTYKQLPNGKYEATLPNGQTKILNNTKVLENYAKNMDLLSKTQQTCNHLHKILFKSQITKQDCNQYELILNTHKNTAQLITSHQNLEL